MSRFDRGWFKLYRTACFEDIGGPPENWQLLGFWAWLLASATVKPTTIRWGKERRDLLPGSILMNMTREAGLRGVSKKRIKHMLDYLESSHRIETIRERNGTIVTICNWEKYQAKQDVDGNETETKEEQSGAEMETKREQSGSERKQKVPHNEERKKERREREVVSTASPSPLDLARLWNELTAPPLPRVSLDQFDASQKRFRDAQSKLKRHHDLDGYWRPLIEGINRLPDCRGENRSGWVANFSYLVAGDNHATMNERLKAQKIAPALKAAPSLLPFRTE